MYTNRRPGTGPGNRAPSLHVRWRMLTRRPLPLLFASIAIVAAACGSGAGGPLATPAGTPSGSPTATPAPSLDPDAIAHPTGSNEIILRMEVGGGMMRAEWNLASSPVFTLYGDGRVIFAAQDLTPPNPGPGAPIVSDPLRTATLTEEQIQDLLEFALRDGGLAAARLRYDDMMVSDAPTTVFTLNAGGAEKIVSVYALGIGLPPSPDTAILTAMAGLAQRISDFDQGGMLASEPFAPETYRGILLDTGGFPAGVPRSWPWPELKTTDFALPGDPNTLQTRSHALTSAQVEAIGIEGPIGAAHGITVTGDDGVVYSLVIRPLLPDEQAAS